MAGYDEGVGLGRLDAPAQRQGHGLDMLLRLDAERTFGQRLADDFGAIRAREDLQRLAAGDGSVAVLTPPAVAQRRSDW